MLRIRGQWKASSQPLAKGSALDGRGAGRGSRSLRLFALGDGPARAIRLAQPRSRQPRQGLQQRRRGRRQRRHCRGLGRGERVASGADPKRSTLPTDRARAIASISSRARRTRRRWSSSRRLLADAIEGEFHLCRLASAVGGTQWALVGYTLAPEASLDEMAAEIQCALDWLAAGCRLSAPPGKSFSPRDGRRARTRRGPMDHPSVRGCVAISGIYDLEPMQIATSTTNLASTRTQPDATRQSACSRRGKFPSPSWLAAPSFR